MRSMNRKALAMVVLGSLTAAGVGFAQEGKEGEGHMPPPEVLQKYDTNKNGKLDDTERAAMRADREKLRAEKLAQFDKNKDGTLDDTERKAMRDSMLAERFKQLDKDGNGQLSLAEFQAGMDHGGPMGWGGGHGRHGGGPR
ncbi:MULTISPECIES: hypothetical protein [Myxococcaceae]|uniref:hypothetical protein n=1 Tax=Myxococcaceae TaxID=31 RepID=UPI00188DE654|nr:MULTISPECIES: hypothetical protein [Myxococcaceae]MBF5043052.1 hypothetical protein [Simulacricoccus sp. 17bor-14]